MFRRIQHPYSTLLKGKAIPAKGINGTFKAKDYLLETVRMTYALISKSELLPVSCECKRMLEVSAQTLKSDADGAPIELTMEEKLFFMRFYPLSMLKQEALRQVSGILQASNPEISKNRITATKKNLTCLYAALCGSKKMSIVSSDQALDIFKDKTTLDFGRFGSAIGIPLDSKSWLIAKRANAFDAVTPEMFRYKLYESGIALGYPIIASSSFANGWDKSSMMLCMLSAEKEFTPWLFDSVFVAPILECGMIGGEWVLRDWHTALLEATTGEAMELLLFESKIETIIRIAQAVAVRDSHATES
jgi:hypothetical protein